MSEQMTIGSINFGNNYSTHDYLDPVSFCDVAPARWLYRLCVKESGVMVLQGLRSYNASTDTEKWVDIPTFYEGSGNSANLA